MTQNSSMPNAHFLRLRGVGIGLSTVGQIAVSPSESSAVFAGTRSRNLQLISHDATERIGMNMPEKIIKLAPRLTVQHTNVTSMCRNDQPVEQERKLSTGFVGPQTTWKNTS